MAVLTSLVRKHSGLPSARPGSSRFEELAAFFSGGGFIGKAVAAGGYNDAVQALKNDTPVAPKIVAADSAFG